ncbi:PREDICTED: homeodomain-only protein-like, partial [Branchiostoma belcheri]|uniref:Homeodomain-only protein n=1 Tax=Branchiostoma belcheri TaxID=7741 RepID=A0A6P4Z8T4_BRABE
YRPRRCAPCSRHTTELQSGSRVCPVVSGTCRPPPEAPRSSRPGSPRQDRCPRISDDQERILEYNFGHLTKTPDGITLEIIAAESGLSVEETAKWFQHRYALWRQKEGLPPNSGRVTD